MVRPQQPDRRRARAAGDRRGRDGPHLHDSVVLGDGARARCVRGAGRRPGSVRLPVGVHAQGGRRLRARHIGRRVPLPGSCLRPRRHRPVEVAHPRNRGGPALRGDPRRARVRGQERPRHRQAQLRLRDRRRPGAVGASDLPRLAAAGADRRPRQRNRPRALLRAARGRGLGRRHVRARRRRRADRADGERRLQAPRDRHDSSRADHHRGGRGHRGDRLPHAAPGPAGARSRHRRRRPDPRTDAVLGEHDARRRLLRRETRCRAPPACGRTASAAPRAP